jgi:hypothetical protein
MRLVIAASPRHQGEALQAVIPELGLSAKPVQFDHREGEIEAIRFGLQHNLFVELEARHVLRRCS